MYNCILCKKLLKINTSLCDNCYNNLEFWLIENKNNNNYSFSKYIRFDNY